MVTFSAFPAWRSPSHPPHHLPISQTRLLIVPPQIQWGEGEKTLVWLGLAPTCFSATWTQQVSHMEAFCWWDCCGGMDPPSSHGSLTCNNLLPYSRQCHLGLVASHTPRGPLQLGPPQEDQQPFEKPGALRIQKQALLTTPSGHLPSLQPSGISRVEPGVNMCAPDAGEVPQVVP